jgi:hypothetical protein
MVCHVLVHALFIGLDIFGRGGTAMPVNSSGAANRSTAVNGQRRQKRIVAVMAGVSSSSSDVWTAAGVKGIWKAEVRVPSGTELECRRD